MTLMKGLESDSNSVVTQVEPGTITVNQNMLVEIELSEQRFHETENCTWLFMNKEAVGSQKRMLVVFLSSML